MIWLLVDEAEYLSSLDKLNKAIEALPLAIPKLTTENTHALPSTEDINRYLISREGKIIIDYRYPEDILGTNYHIFTVVEVRSPDFPFTAEHTRIGEDKGKILAQRLGLRIIKPTVTFDDMAGAGVLHEDMLKMMNLEDMGLMNITGLFLFGVAGAGKSYFAECFAGTSKRYFVMLDLAYFMSLKNPVKSIDDVFLFLLGQKEKYILLIDEIEKMFQLDGTSTHLISEQIFGKMLTWLATIYSMKKSNLTFVATANRVENLLKYKPEFVRRGRFDRLYFLNYPQVDSSAIEIFEMYLSKERKHIQKALHEQYGMHKNNKKLQSEKLEYIFNQLRQYDITIDWFISVVLLDKMLDVRRIIQIIEGLIGRDKITDAEYFIYSPPEIQSISKELLQTYIEELSHKIFTQEISIDEVKSNQINLRPIDEVLEDIVFSTPPLQITAPEGIGYQLAQANKVKQNDRISPFTEIS